MTTASSTVLRVKRKRTTAQIPLDAVVLESSARTKRQKIFKYAETVTSDQFTSVTAANSLRSRLDALSVLDASSTSVSPGNPSGAPSPVCQRRLRLVGPHQRAAEQNELKPMGNCNLVDLEDTEVESSVSTENGIDMDMFVPLLKDYLSLREDEPLRTSDAFALVDRRPQTELEQPQRQAREDKDDSEYVYDVYYYSTAPLASQQFARMGQLTGLHLEDLLVDAEDLSEEEVQDEADEDSNDEGFYKNDYPDESSEAESIPDGSTDSSS